MIFNLIVSIISGVLTGFSFYSSNLSFLIWFSFFPLFSILYKTKNPTPYFFFSGLAHYITVIFWLGHVSCLGLLFLTIYLSLYWLFFGYLARFLVKKKGALIILPSLWVVLEFLRENFPHMGFGWAIFGYSQYANLFLIQISDIFGAKSISFLIITVNLIIFKCLKERKIVIKDLIYGAVIIAIALSYSLYKLNKDITSDDFTLSIVQPNIAQELKWDPRARPFIINKLGGLGREIKVDSLIIYPEASWPGIVDEQKLEKIKEIATTLERDILIGAVVDEEDKFYNAAILIDREGNKRGVYHKIRLVPFGEYVPLRGFFGFIEALNALGDISGGEDSYIFDYKDKRFGVVICFEDTFPLLVSKFAKKSDFLINITNDGWFKGNPQARQHMAIMIFRAIENRIPIVRSANTGISGYVDSLGNVYTLRDEGKEVLVEGAGTFLLFLNLERSVYNRWGEFFSLLCFFIVVAGLIKRVR